MESCQTVARYTSDYLSPRGRERETERERERQGEREAERERGRDGERERERESTRNPLIIDSVYSSLCDVCEKESHEQSLCLYGSLPLSGSFRL